MDERKIKEIIEAAEEILGCQNCGVPCPAREKLWKLLVEKE